MNDVEIGILLVDITNTLQQKRFHGDTGTFSPPLQPSATVQGVFMRS